MRFRFRDKPRCGLRMRELSGHEQIAVAEREVAELQARVDANIGEPTDDPQKLALVDSLHAARKKLDELCFRFLDGAPSRSDGNETTMRGINARNAEFWRPV
jgi:hypothetical protein